MWGRGVRLGEEGYSRGWKGWEFKTTAQGPHSSHTKGCPQNAPHSLNPLSCVALHPHHNVLWVFPNALTQTRRQTDTHTHTHAEKAGKETGQTVYRTDLVASVHSLEQNRAAGGNSGLCASGVQDPVREKRNHSPDSNNLKGKAVWRARPKLRTQQLFL